MYLTMCWNFLMGIDSGKGKGGGGGGPDSGAKRGLSKSNVGLRVVGNHIE